MTDVDHTTAGGWYERSWRWWVLGTLFLATFLNYLDRQTLGVAMDPIAREFNLSTVERGELLAAFVFSYALAHLFIGFLLDRVRNIRAFFPAMVVGWSVSNMLVGLAQDFTQILWLRYLLGVWESANFPLCILLIARIFPPKERSFASGVFYSGAFIASLIAPKLVIWIANAWDWRYSFTVTGLFGILWIVPWLLIFRHPERRALEWPGRQVSRWKEVAAAQTSPSPSRQAGSLLDILALPAFWGVLLIGLGIIPGLYFATQWLPSFLTQSWGMEYNQALGNRLTAIYLCQDLGLWIGGGLVWALARRGLPILRARKAVIVAGYALMMSVLLIPSAQSVTGCLVLLCLYVFGLSAWLANQQAFKQEVAPRRVATVAALIGFAETGFSAFILQSTGQMVENYGGFSAVFMMFAGFFTFALICVFVFLRPKWLQIERPLSAPVSAPIQAEAPEPAASQ